MIYVGAKTGRDGIHGASLLASAEFTEESQQKRPNVQVGDPFVEKLLLEACLEAMSTGAVVAIQDMGAAGLTCSTLRDGFARRHGHRNRSRARAAARNRHDALRNHAQRIAGAHAAGRRARAASSEVLQVFAKWGLDAVVVGEVAEGGLLRVKDHGKIVAEIPAHPLAEEGPVYQRPMAAPAQRQETARRLVRIRRREEKSHGKFQAPARVAGDRIQALDHRAVRHHGAHQYAGGARCR